MNLKYQRITKYTADVYNENLRLKQENLRLQHQNLRLTEQNWKLKESLKMTENRVSKLREELKMAVSKLKEALELKVEYKTDYPDWWSKVDIVSDEEQCYGNSLYTTPHLITLNMNEEPARSVVDQFKRTCSDKTVLKVEGVQNQKLWDYWCFEREKMIAMIGPHKVTEKVLFHGTGSLQVMDIIEKEGFRKEFVKRAMYGQGTYFARDASYSADKWGGYCGKSGTTYKMFVCRVLIGDTFVGNKGITLSSWPKKDEKNGNGLMYDCLVDNGINPEIFVIHNDTRAYPMYIVHFEKPKKK